jgi:hypothetical protein
LSYSAHPLIPNTVSANAAAPQAMRNLVFIVAAGFL